MDVMFFCRMYWRRTIASLYAKSLPIVRASPLIARNPKSASKMFNKSLDEAAIYAEGEFFGGAFVNGFRALIRVAYINFSMQVLAKSPSALQSSLTGKETRIPDP
jgi:hypothetical protein